MKTSPTLFALFPILHLSFFLLLTVDTSAQTNVRAWYAQGQVWVVWQTAPPFPETYAIYKKNTAFNNVNQATIIGRLFQYEYLSGTYLEQTLNPGFTYKIPQPDGSIYTLAPGEGLFVETVTGTGSAYYAVAEWGSASVTNGVNITSTAVPCTYDPVNDPVTCHLQLTQTLPTGHKTNWYSMWAFGRQEHWAGRPDFPVMANAFKNGMPSMFIVSEALAMDTTSGKKIPLTHWFHGGGMVASQFLANDFRVFNCEPKLGISVSHNDDFAVKTVTEEGDTVFTAGRSLWFGWTKSHNPFNPGFDAGAGDTVINYTQRRIMWINDWLIKHYNVNPNRVALQGYSMGSAGASALGKAFPNRFSTVCAFNNGYRGGMDPTSQRIMGSAAENLPTSLRRAPNDVVRVNEVFDLTTPMSIYRDFPLFRTWAGKNDPNDRMHWGPDLIAQYRIADSLGLGTQISWDERFHVYDVLGMHWIKDFSADQQTYRDDLNFQELFQSNQSFPAFFNHRLEPLNNDPGIGMPGINNGDGDNWGTWGGWHNWDVATLTDEPGVWEVTAWLTGNAAFPNDNCPEQALLTTVAIRKPQAFHPAPGKMLQWRVSDISNNLVIQAGLTTVQPNGLVVVPQIFVTKETFRKIRIKIFDPSVATQETEELLPDNAFFPNPTSGILFFKNEFETLRIFDLNGKILLEKHEKGAMQLDVSHLQNGFYFVEISGGNGARKISRFVKN